MVACEVEVELLLVDLMLLGGWNVQVFQRLSCFRLFSSFAVLMLSRSVPFLASCSFCFARNDRMRSVLVDSAMMWSLVVEFASVVAFCVFSKFMTVLYCD